MPDERRREKTREKMRRGGLPAPTEHTQLLGAGDGRPCDGCGETIHPSETSCTVSVLRGFDWRFHESCYDVWATFTRE